MTTRNNLSRRKFLKMLGATTAGAIAANVFNPSSIAIAASGDRADSAKTLAIGGAIFYPETYGAHADEYPDEESSNPNATDNTAAIQAAIDAAFAAGGGVVQLATGTYKITRAIRNVGIMYCLRMKENVILQGNGIDVTRLKLADNQFRVDNGGSPVFEHLFIIETDYSCDNVWVKNLTVMGRRARQGTLVSPYLDKRMRGIRLNVGQNAHGSIDHVKVTGVGESGNVYVSPREHFGIELVNGNGFHISDCQVTKTFGSGIAFDGAGNNAAHVASNCVVWDNLAMGFALWNTSGATVEYCEAYGNGVGLNDEIGHGTIWQYNKTHHNDIGVVINTDGVESQSVHFLHNTISFNTTHGVKLIGTVTNTEIGYNEIKDNGNCGIKIRTTGATYNMHDNTFARNGGGAICYP